MKRKAVSPIVATTLLIVLSMGISAIIISWITPIANNNLEKSDYEDAARNYCATARADIVSIHVTNTNKTTISIQNIGDADINLTDSYIYNQDYQSCELSLDDSNLEVGDFAIATNTSCPIINTCDDFLFVDVVTNCKNIQIRYNGELTNTSDGGCKL